jgi:hypothetical protein
LPQPNLPADFSRALYSRRMAQAIQIIGALIILGAFAANQLGELPTDSRLYLVANVVGSVILCILLEAVWAIVSGWSLFVILGEEAGPPA